MLGALSAHMTVVLPKQPTKTDLRYSETEAQVRDSYSTQGNHTKGDQDPLHAQTITSSVHTRIYALHRSACSSQLPSATPGRGFSRPAAAEIFIHQRSKLHYDQPSMPAMLPSSQPPRQPLLTHLGFRPLVPPRSVLESARSTFLRHDLICGS